MTPVIAIKQMTLADLDMLHEFCCEVYSQNFFHHWNEDGLERYIHKAFGISTLKAELPDKSIQYYIAFVNQKPAGFMKINLCSNLPGLDNENGMELDKIYILPALKGMKVGKHLLELAFDIARLDKKEIFWLSVIDTNTEAISFYEKAGFKFHSKTRLEYPKFKEELKGMWRMFYKLEDKAAP